MTASSWQHCAPGDSCATGASIPVKKKRRQLPSMQQTIMDLQRSAGNAATSMFVQRSGGAFSPTLEQAPTTHNVRLGDEVSEDVIITNGGSAPQGTTYNWRWVCVEPVVLQPLPTSANGTRASMKLRSKQVTSNNVGSTPGVRPILPPPYAESAITAGAPLSVTVTPPSVAFAPAVQPATTTGTPGQADPASARTPERFFRGDMLVITATLGNIVADARPLAFTPTARTERGDATLALSVGAWTGPRTYEWRLTADAGGYAEFLVGLTAPGETEAHSTTHTVTILENEGAEAALRWYDDERATDPLVSDWLQAAHLGIDASSSPADPTVRSNFQTALAGNLVWAATSLIPSPMTTAIRALSFAGAAVGSGAAADPPAPDPRGGLFAALAAAADGLRPPREAVVAAANRCGRENITTAGARRQALWEALWGDVPYDSRRTVIQARVVANINAAMARYEAAVARALEEHSDEIDQLVAPHNNRGPMPRPSRIQALFMLGGPTFVMPSFGQPG